MSSVPSGVAATEGVGGNRAGRQLQLADLRNDDHFPAFDDLSPNFYAGDPDASDDEIGGGPANWCFLAEILDAENFTRVRLVVRDKEGAKVVLAFYTEDRGNELKRSLLRPGNTVAVLRARSHQFLDSSVGVRQEKENAVKIITATLTELLRLSDSVRIYSKDAAGKVCHGCDEEKKPLLRCAKCAMFWYCGRDCQMTGWNEKGHKRDCKIIRDNDLRSFFLFNWTSSQAKPRFPLPAPTAG
ncbi:uncharacterized protein E0L32_010258 [Thyridium curvatum]|uniref:MYND-type domain-containing protein n=1 Tax=Thyridium curvatum TaxID=1093900 RepID=A0A507AT63_9PEZI|nr:uncharacterized protein E0L32_010258 [Thyridium curvatum]TPX08058.1 hypothetical protein E0L32_010258 [Thyridium curvatum]